MANTNVLEGWRCPDCGNTGRFKVEATTLAEITDDGADAGDLEWGPDSYAVCSECGTDGIVETFRPERLTSPRDRR